MRPAEATATIFIFALLRRFPDELFTDRLFNWLAYRQPAYVLAGRTVLALEVPKVGGIMRTCYNPEHKEPVPADFVLIDRWQLKPRFLCVVCAWVLDNSAINLGPQEIRDLAEWEEEQLTGKQLPT